MRIQIGNAKTSGFVNAVFPDKARFLVGTGSYTAKDGNRVFKETVTVFLDPTFNGVMPKKGDYVEIHADLTVASRKDDTSQLSVSANVRFANQIVPLKPPVKGNAEQKAEGAGQPAAAAANSEDI